jgi:hypothetical protein
MAKRESMSRSRNTEAAGGRKSRGAASSRKPARRRGRRRYGPVAAKKVEETMRERKRGTLRSGSGGKVKTREQAIAIGLSKARKAGAKVPPDPEPAQS